MEKVCPICKAKNIDKAKFCSNCGSQLNCTSCNEEILVGANNCIACGAAIKQMDSNIAKQTAMNTIDFRQTNDERTIKVAFTNEAAKEVRESIVQMSSIRASNIKFIEHSASQQAKSEELYSGNGETLDIPSEEIKPVSNSTTTDTIPHLNDIQKLQIGEAEWILVMAFYKSNYGNSQFSKEDVRSLYYEHRQTDSRAKNYANNWNSLFGTQKGLIVTIKENSFQLTDLAKQKVIQLINGEVKGNAGTKKQTAKKKAVVATENKETQNNEEQKKTKKSSSAKASTLTLVATLNLNPPKEKSLKEFYNSYKLPNNFLSKNLIIIYYLERVAKVPNISVNHVYTCYKHLAQKVSGNLYQSLVDTKKYKGWIDTSNVDNLKITVSGENYVEHDMHKA